MTYNEGNFLFGVEGFSSSGSSDWLRGGDGDGSLFLYLNHGYANVSYLNIWTESGVIKAITYLRTSRLTSYCYRRSVEVPLEAIVNEEGRRRAQSFLMSSF